MPHQEENSPFENFLVGINFVFFTVLSYLIITIDKKMITLLIKFLELRKLDKSVPHDLG